MSCEVCRLGCCVLAEIISFAHGGILITCVLSMDCVCHEQATIHKNCLPDRSRYSSNVSRVPFQFIWSQRLFGAIVVLGVELEVLHLQNQRALNYRPLALCTNCAETLVIVSLSR